MKSSRPALRGFLAACHDKGVRYLLDPKTRDDAIRTMDLGQIKAAPDLDRHIVTDLL